MRLKRFKDHNGNVSEYHLGPWRLWKDKRGGYSADLPLIPGSTIEAKSLTLLRNLIGQIEQGTITLAQAQRKEQ